MNLGCYSGVSYTCDDGFNMKNTTSFQSRALLHITPLTLLTILDHHTRRPDEYSHSGVIGVLLGTIQHAELWQSSSYTVKNVISLLEEDRVLQIRNAFPLVHSSSEQKAVEMNLEFQSVMMELHARVNDKERLLGWYTTAISYAEDGTLVLPPALLQLYEAYIELIPNPIFLTLDATLEKPGLELHAYQNILSGGLSEISHGMLLSPLPWEIRHLESEIAGLQMIHRAKNNREDHAAPPYLVSELQQWEQAIVSLRIMLDKVALFVKQVVDGERPADPNLGRQLMEALSCMFKVDTTSFEATLNAHLQDIFMIIQLANLTKTQTYISEKLQLLP
jgi:translation initiation factor 3 subunit F